MESREIVLIRNVSEEYQELGNFFVFDGDGRKLFECKSLELAWRDNQRNISCIPAGSYDIVFEWSSKYSMYLWEMKDVPGRTETKIHAANYFRQLQGCIALGDMHIDMDGDTYRDVRNSVKTILKFHTAMEPVQSSKIHIIDLKTAHRPARRQFYRAPIKYK